MGDPGMGRRQSPVPRKRLLALIRAYRLENAELRARLDLALEQLALRVAGPCVCGEPPTLGVVHRKDGPCYHPASSTAEGPREVRDGVW